MNILIISQYGESAYSWHRFEAEGNKVKVFIVDKNYRKEIYQGLIDKVDAYQPFISWADIVVFDQNGLVNEWKVCSKTKPCFGASEFGHLMEKDRKLSREVFEYVGLKKLESNTFKTVKEAQDHVKSHKTLHVIKPFGKDVSSEDIIISEDESGEDAVALLHRFESRHIKFDGIEVEERKLGIECALSAWCSGRQGFVGPIELNFENKKVAVGDIGYLTGEMGTIMTYVDRDNYFFKQTLSKLEPLCKEMDYRGQIDVSFIADKDGFWPLEFTPRFGYPALALNMSLQETPLTELISGIAKGTLKENKVRPGWCIGVVVVSYGFPFSDEVKKRSKEYPIFNLDESNYDHVFLYEAKAGWHDTGKPGLVTSDGMGYLYVVTGNGKTVEEAQKDCYRFLNTKDPDRIRVPNSFWRLDIGNRVIEKKVEIIKYGIIDKI